MRETWSMCTVPTFMIIILQVSMLRPSSASYPDFQASLAHCVLLHVHKQGSDPGIWCPCSANGMLRSLSTPQATVAGCLTASRHAACAYLLASQSCS